MNKKQKIAISVICGILAAVIAAFGIFCIVKKENPVTAVKDIFKSPEEQIVGIWDSDSAPGFTAYIFEDDGTYQYYISSASITGKYEIKGNKITLKKVGSSLQVTYKFSVSEKELYLSPVNQDKEDEKESSKYNRVKELKQKSINDLLGDLKGNIESENEE